METVVKGGEWCHVWMSKRLRRRAWCFATSCECVATPLFQRNKAAQFWGVPGTANDFWMSGSLTILKSFALVSSKTKHTFASLGKDVHNTCNCHSLLEFALSCPNLYEVALILSLAFMLWLETCRHAEGQQGYIEECKVQQLLLLCCTVSVSVSRYTGVCRTANYEARSLFTVLNID